MQNEELTPEQQMFCVYYSRTFNAAQSYMKTFNCTYDTAHAKGYSLVAKVGIKEEIERLKELKRSEWLKANVRLVNPCKCRGKVCTAPE